VEAHTRYQPIPTQSPSKPEQNQLTYKP
jgi:hypothetical protein